MVVKIKARHQYEYRDGMLKMLWGPPIKCKIKIIRREVGKIFKFAILNDEGEEIMIHESVGVIKKIIK